MIPKAFIRYLVHFHGDRDYFECHEVLEEYWKKTEPRNKSSILVGFILLAVANYHHRRGNLAGALKTLEKSKKIFTSERKRVTEFAIHEQKLMNLIQNQLKAIQSGTPYKSIYLPIADASLIEACKQECKKLGLVWGKESNLSDKNLIHRHSLRDRTDVIIERKTALEKKKLERKNE